MKHALCILALEAASKATQRAHDHLRALGCYSAAGDVFQAGTLIASAIGKLCVRRGAWQEEAS